MFFGPAIAYALALFGLCLLCPREVREKVSPFKIVGASAKAGWVQLRRWTHSIRTHALFGFVRPCPPDFSSRKVAERTAATLAAEAWPAIPFEAIELRVFRGACLAP
jgi:hypothetical protein